jgi:hypothetical protein
MNEAENDLIQKISHNVNHVIGVHYAVHRLNLKVLNSIKNGKYVDDYESVLKRLYKFYQYSPKRMGQLKQVAERIQCSIKKCQ